MYKYQNAKERSKFQQNFGASNQEDVRSRSRKALALTATQLLFSAVNRHCNSSSLYIVAVQFCVDTAPCTSVRLPSKFVFNL